MTKNTDHTSLNGHPALAHQAEPEQRPSEAFDTIISYKPNFLERWSLVFILLIFLTILASTAFIRYPDIVHAEGTLTAEDASKEIVTRAEGKLVKLFVSNDDSIAQNSMIGWIDGTASHKDVIALNQTVDSAIFLLQRGNIKEASVLFRMPFKTLGEIQSAYEQFVAVWLQFNDYLVNDYYSKKRNALINDLVYYKKMHALQEEQHALTMQDVQLTKESFQMNDMLYNEKALSKQDLRVEAGKLVGKKMNIPLIESQLLTNENMQANKQKEIEELDHSISQQKIIFLQALQTLKSVTDDWLKKYILRAPVSGKAVFITPVQENQFVQSGKVLGFVSPSNSRYYLQANLPQGNFGKLAIGQRVQVRFDAYPYQEFGFVEGKLQYISKVATDSGLLATVLLTKGLTTNYGTNIQYKSGLKATALVITKNASLLQRLYYTITRDLQR